MKFWNSIYAPVACSIFIVDIVTKQWALTACQQEVVINQFFSCELVMNRGFSWSMLHSSSPEIFMLVNTIILGAVIILGNYTYYQWQLSKNIMGEVIVMTGALANMLDRKMYGGVVDFIVVHYHDCAWPVFNVADIAVVLGVFIMLYTNWNAE